MKLSGEKKCFVCDTSFSWVIGVCDPEKGMNFDIKKGEIIGEAFAVGTSTADDVRMVDYEMVVRCPYCGNNNKFKESAPGI